MGLERGFTINVLDHGYVQLMDFMGSDETVITAARMSTGKGFITWESYRRCPECGAWSDQPAHTDECSRPKSVDAKHDLKLLAYLYKNRHHTPLEMVEILLKVKAPLFIWRQWHRHRAANYNEQSARYGQLDSEFYYPTVDTLKRQSSSNKQGGSSTFDPDLAHDLINVMKDREAGTYNAYEQLLRSGVAREQARLVLPVNIYSTCMVKMNLRMALHFLGLRDDSHAQGEMQEYGKAVARIIAAIAPRVYDLYIEHTKEARTLSRTDVENLRDELKDYDDLIKRRDEEDQDWAIKSHEEIARLLKVLG